MAMEERASQLPFAENEPPTPKRRRLSAKQPAAHFHSGGDDVVEPDADDAEFLEDGPERRRMLKQFYYLLDKFRVRKLAECSLQDRIRKNTYCTILPSKGWAKHRE